MSQESITLKTMPAKISRGLTGMAGLLCMAFGAGLLWGVGGALFALGLFVAIDQATDEVVERVTGVRRIAA